MKKVLFITLFSGFIALTYGQQIEIGGVYAASSFKKFKNSFGYTVGYYKTVKSKNRLGFSFSEYFCTAPYDDIFHPEYDPASLCIDQVNPSNNRYSIAVSYAFGLVNNPKSKLYFGPEMGLNYFVVNEYTERISNGDIEGGNFNSSSAFYNRIGIGFLLEYELEEVVAKRISTYLSINPEFTSYEKFGTMGSSSPYFIGWLNFKFGIRYNLKSTTTQ
jgi:hypothetical protein